MPRITSSQSTPWRGSSPPADCAFLSGAVGASTEQGRLAFQRSAFIGNGVGVQARGGALYVEVSVFSGSRRRDVDLLGDAALVTDAQSIARGAPAGRAQLIDRPDQGAPPGFVTEEDPAFVRAVQCSAGAQWHGERQARQRSHICASAQSLPLCTI